MAPRKKSVTEYLESRIQFYRYCAVALLVLGLLAGASVLCEKCALFSVGWFGRYQVLVKCTLCFAVSLSGIAAASAYRRRIRYIVERGNRILLYSDEGPSFPKPVREPFIFEVQVLFGMLFVLAAVVCSVGYPVPGLPAHLDLPLVRLTLFVAFFLFCRISARIEKKNSITGLSPVEDFIRQHQKQARIGKYEPALVPVEWAPENTHGDGRASTIQNQMHIQR